MWIQQVFVACLSVLLGLQQITAVVNNGQKTNELLTSNTTINIAVKNITSDNHLKKNNISSVSDSYADSSELNRREAPLGLSTSYGIPLSTNSVGLIQDTYVPLFSSNIGLPTPVYGVPDAPTNNIIYPAPPPDIPPPIQSVPNLYGPPKDVHGLPAISLPPPKYGPPPVFNRPLKPLSFPSFNVPKPLYGSPAFSPPKPQYGPPSKPLFLPNKIPRPTYGLPIKLPKPQYGLPKPLHIPSKPLNTYGPPEGYFNGPKNIYGPPKTVYAPSKGVYVPSPAIQYGPPEPIPHGPPHPGAPAPPTPPDIKYDGWQPIPGLVSRPPSGTYGVPQAQPHGFNDLQFNADFVPPPSGGHVSGLSGSHKGSSGLSDSYGAPLNTVTGSGGIVTTSGDTLHGSGIPAFDFSGSTGHGGNGLSVIKSIGYEIVPNSGHVANSYSPNGFYAAAHSYDSNGLSTLSTFDNFASSIASSFDTTVVGNSNAFNDDFSLNVGLIPPSGVYGVPPSGKFGTPLLHSSNTHNSFGLHLNRPKHPVAFREPVPAGLIESIGNAVAQKDAQGIIENAHSNNFAGPTYVPPPVPDVGNVKPVKEEEPSPPSTLYSLPNKNPISFQSYVHGSSTAGLNGDFSSSLNLNGATASALTSYSAPLATIDGSYGLPQTGGGLGVGFTSSQASNENFGAASHGNFAATSLENFGATSHAVTDNYALPASISNTFGTQYFSNYQNVGHDCSQRSQPVPSLSFGVPAASSYTASLSSLNTNIAGAYQGPAPSLNYGAADLQTAHSQASGSVSGTNSNTLSNLNDEDKQQAELTGKSLASNFGSESELIKSQSLDLNNIPLQGTLGSYTLQIQSADGSGGVTSVPHNQVLSDGLLQSILNAIEQPQQNTAAILRQPLIHLQQIPPQVNSNYNINGFHQSISSTTDQRYEDSQAQHSAAKNIVVTPPPLQTTVVLSSKAEPEQTVTERSVGDDKDSNLPLIDNNEIALYFSNKAEFPDSKEKHNIKDHQSRGLKGDSMRHGRQYSSYVSFKNLKSPNSTVEDNGKPAYKKT